MKITIQSKEYIKVLYLCALGSYIIKNSELKDDMNSEDILSTLLNFNKGLLNIDAEASKKLGCLQQNIMDSASNESNYLQSYDETSFWKTLANKMASRDALEQIDECFNSGKTYGEYMELRENIKREYLKKFKNVHYDNNVLPY